MAHPEIYRKASREFRKRNRSKLNAYQREYYSKNSDKFKGYRSKLPKKAKHIKKTKSEIESYQIAYRVKNADRISAGKREYYLQNKELIRSKLRIYRRKRLATDPVFKLKQKLKKTLHYALRGVGAKKHSTTMTLLGCSISEFKKHIESQFKPGMTWGNRGIFGWHIDHKRPIASFNLLDLGDQKRCFHYTNLQPLWASENIAKRDKMIAA